MSLRWHAFHLYEHISQTILCTSRRESAPILAAHLCRIGVFNSNLLLPLTVNNLNLMAKFVIKLKCLHNIYCILHSSIQTYNIHIQTSPSLPNDSTANNRVSFQNARSSNFLPKTCQNYNAFDTIDKFLMP